MSSVSRVECLSKDNYDTWVLQMEALLIKGDLWDYVNGKCQKSVEDQEQLVWLRNDKKAKAEIILSINPSELKQIRGCDSSKDVWMKLQDIYASKGPARKATLLKQLMLQKLEEGGNLREHIKTFFDAVDKLDDMKVNINDEMLTIMLLYSLPPSFENFRCAIESRDQLPSAESLKVKIMEESDARKQSTENKVIALAADMRKKKVFRSNEATVKPTFKCFKCGKVGHKANVCFSKRKGVSTDSNKENVYTASSIECANIANDQRRWILDSGCTTHLCGNKELFSNIDDSVIAKINLANEASAKVHGKGKVQLSLDNECGNVVEFQNTLLVPDLRTNLISVAKITDRGHKVVFSNDGAKVYNEVGKLTLLADRIDHLFYVRENVHCNVAAAKVDDLMKWHNRLGHLNENDLIKMFRNNTLTGDFKAFKTLSKCEICLKGKMSTLPFVKNNKPCQEPLMVIHSDVVGPFRNKTHNGSQYFVTFIDDSTRWCEVYFLSKKNGVFEAFKAYKCQIEKQTGKKIKCLQTDNGGEYVNKEFDRYLINHGIRRRLTIPHTPQQNGVAERMNRTLLDMTRCLLLQSGLDSVFWDSCVATASHIRNRCPTRILRWKSPYEQMYGRKPDLSYLRTFGSRVIVIDKDPTRSKLAPRGIEGIFVGYPRDRKAYRIWIPEKQKILYSRDVKFLDECERKDRSQCDINLLSSNEDSESIKDVKRYVEFYSDVEVNNEGPFISENQQELDGNQEVSVELYSSEQQENVTQRRGPGRPKIVRTGARGRPRKVYCTKILPSNDRSNENSNESNSEYEDAHSGTDGLLRENVPESQSLNEDNGLGTLVAVAEMSIQEALRSSSKDEWLDAIESEVTSLIKNKTWEIINVTDERNLVGCRFVFTNKCDANGNIQRRKARLVAKGYSQKYGVDYFETFAPVARLETLRLLLALSVQFKFKIWQFDVVTAYLNGNLNEAVLMKIPETLGIMLERIISKQGKNSEIGARAIKMQLNLREGGNACLLKKALYGLKQAGRQWYAKLSEKLKEIGLKCMKNESCLFLGNFDGESVFVLIYVDDILIATNNQSIVIKVQSELSKVFELKDLGLAKYCLGLQIEQGNDEIKLKQTGYINEILKRYGMYDCNSVLTPAEVGTYLDDTKSVPYKGTNYREAIGALMYLTVATRPDISNTVSRLAQFCNNPSECHWNGLKRVFRYLSGTADMGLTYKRTNQNMIAFTDADWGGCTIDRRSYTGYVFILSGAAIAWKSQKQRTVALSSTEAEYVSLAEAAKEAIYLRSLLNELDLKEIANTIIYVDNKGAEQLAKNPVFHARTKHIDLRHHFVRESIEHGLFELKHVSTKDMIADVLTKPLARISHQRCMNGIGLSH